MLLEQVGDHVIHYGDLKSGALSIGLQVHATIDESVRRRSARYITYTLCIPTLPTRV
jgi:alanyl-tRNA synthetase